MTIDHDIPNEEFERGLAALGPFAEQWRLQLNPEDLAEMAYAVLVHARSSRTFDEIDRAVRDQLADYKEKQEAFQREAYGDES